MFDNVNVNLRKNKGFLTCISYVPIPEYGQSNAPLVTSEIWPQLLVITYVLFPYMDFYI